MNFVVDLIIVLIIVISALLAYRKGLISLSVQLLATIISILIIIVIYKPVSNLIINTTGIDEYIQNGILEKVTDVVEQDKENNNQIVETIENGMLPETARNLSIDIVQGGVILILYILLRIALRFVTGLVNIVAKVPIIKQINKLGGVLYGIIRGILLVYVILLLVNLSGNINSNNTVYKSVESSTLGKFMNENNLIAMAFKWE